MKMMKKLATLLLTVCLIIPGFSMVAQAASGQIMFTDPETAVGQTVEVKGVLKADSNIEDREISMTYDTTMLKFVEGDNVTESSEGKLTYEVTGKKDTDRVEFVMKFSALKEGTTKIEVESYKAWNTSNQSINCTKGASTIKIAAGEGTAPETPVETTDVEVYVDGVSYTLASTFEDSVIPEGFQKTEFDYQGTKCTAVANESASVFLGYLVAADGAGDFFLYLMETASFVPYEAIKISDSVVIALLSDTSEVVLPEQYMTTEVSVNETAYPAWQNVDEPSRCVLYALNSNGEKALYQYDAEEGTYQRFIAPEVVEEQTDESAFGKLTDLLENHMDYVVLGTGLGFILFVLIIIILSVKLYNRNAELDELYDEYGILDEDEESKDSEEDKTENLDDDSEDALVILDDDDSDGVFVIDDAEGIFETDDDADEFFINIEDATEDDIVIAEVDEENDKAMDEEDEEIEVEFFEQFEEINIEEVVEEVVEEVTIPTVSIEEDETEYFDDDDDDDFEIDFIDLDD